MTFHLAPAHGADGSDAQAPGNQKNGLLQNWKAEPHWSQSADVYASVNPMGLDISGGIGYLHPYGYDRQQDEVTASWEAGGGIDLSPSYLQPSVYAEWMPFPVVTIRAEYDPYFYFGKNHGSLSFPAAQSAFGDPELRAREGTEDAGAGSRLFFQPTLQFKIGDIVVRNQSDFARYRFPGPGPFYWVQDYDTLLPNGGWLFANRTQVLKEMRSSRGTTYIGPYYEMVQGAEGTTVRRQIGVLLYSERRGPDSADQERHVVAQVGYDLTDQNREGQVYFLIGLGFSSGLW